MNLGAVHHRTSDNYCYPINEYDLIINIKTGYDVEKVYICHGDPFSAGILGGNEAWSGDKEEIIFKKRLKNQVWWTTTLKPEFKRCRYYFELIVKDEKWYYFEDGFLSEAQMHIEGRSMQCFTFPWMNSSDINRVPEWVNKTVWYQIFPDRFNNGDHSIDPPNVCKWQTGPVKNSEFYGGDLKGIIDKLDYLKDLGINGIYLTPINESPSTHKYDTTDYEKIDEYFGDEETMKQLVRDAHNRGIRIMLDGVFNHCGQNFKIWRDVVEKGQNSEYADWFMVNEWPVTERYEDVKKGKYYTFAFHEKMPKLNTNNQKVRDYLISVCKKWVLEYDVDGIRLDVANEVSHTFCKELRRELKSVKPDIYILGEIWHDSINWLRGDEFDAVMNYPLAGSIKDFWLDESLTKEDFEYTINRCYTMYMQQNNDVLFNLLDSHDTIRLRNCVKNIDEFYQELAILFTMPGSTCIFYGTEIAMEGSYDPDCRRCMPWTDINEGKYDEYIQTIKQLISLRHNEPLTYGRNFHFPNTIANKRVIEYIKVDGYGHEIRVVINCSHEEVTVETDKRILFERLYNNKTLMPGGILIYESNK